MSSNELIISDEFKTLAGTIPYGDVLSENIFKIVSAHVKYDFMGIFFNTSNVWEKNIFNLSLPNNNISLALTDEIRDKFFDEMEHDKRILEIQCNLVNGDLAENSDLTLDSFKTKLVKTFQYGNKFSGGFCLGRADELTDDEIKTLERLAKELEFIFNIKYLFDEQAKYSVTDPMTGLFNRKEFDVTFEQEFYKARRYIYNFSVVVLDIDDLSGINEKYGREFGDFVIAELASLLKQVFRKTDPLYRFDSKQVMILLPFTPITKAIIPIERLRQTIAEHPFEKGDIKTNVTVSVGISANYSKFTEPEQLLDGVCTAVRRAKEHGYNKVDIFE